MQTLTGDNLLLRALEPEDLDFVYSIENDENVWDVSNTKTPYSRFLIRQYLENAQQDIYEAKQLRLAIELKAENRTIGLIDLFDFDPFHLRAGVGILIQAESDRREGYGSEALELLIRYVFAHLNLHQLYANINGANQGSVKLFTTFGFLKTGEKKDWNLVDGRYHDEGFYQLFNPAHKAT